jgi:AraC-like DNA-binding protein
MEPLSLSPDPGLRVVACGLFISSGKGTHPDRVLNDHELIVVRKGTLSIWEDDVLFNVPAGHALLLYAGRRHRGATPFARDLSFYWIHFVPQTQRRRKALLQVPQFCKVARPDCIAELFHRYLDDQEAKRLDPLYASLLLLQILCEVSRPLEVRAARGAALSGRAEAYVTRHLADQLSTARIAHALRTNPDYLNRVFREVHHLTVTEYIQRRRLTDAAGMLRDTADGISEVAAACGYASVGHFRRLFQRFHGMSPGAYRRLMARAFVNAR